MSEGHVTHYDDCGCQSAALKERIATLEAELAASREDARAGWAEQGQMALECYALLATANDLRAALEKLACLGNGDMPGNSEGNVIAQRALAANAVPAASLAAYRKSVIEACVLEMERRGWLRADAMHELTEEGFVSAFAGLEAANG